MIRLGPGTDFPALAALSDAQWARVSPRRLRQIHAALTDYLREDHRRCQLAYYRPVNDQARAVHRSCARIIGIQGGNKGAKTATMLAELAIQLTKVIPQSLAADYPREKLRPCPLRARLVVTSFTAAWDTNLRQKLQWWEWNGTANEDGLIGDPTRGHWGLIPQEFLLGGDWARSWSERHRALRLTCGCQLFVMSHEQGLEDFNQGSFHWIGEDELPPEDIHRANLIRLLDFRGQLMVGGTATDDLSSAVGQAWFFDQVMVPGLNQTNPAEVAAVILRTEDNPYIDAETLAALTADLTPEQRRARLEGEPLHLSGLVLPEFTERRKWWCFGCEGPVRIEAAPSGGEQCAACGATAPTPYQHVWVEDDLAWPGPAEWPLLFYIDPHQGKPTACAWYKIDPQDGWWQVAELEISGDALAVKEAVEAFEQGHRWRPVWRKGDPKIIAQTNQFAARVGGEVFSIQRAFQEVGFLFDAANTTFSVAIERLRRALRPNPLTHTPRLRISSRCPKTIYQVGHFSFKISRRDGRADETPGRAHSDFPALLRYLAMDDPGFRALQLLQHGSASSTAARGHGRNPRTGW